jgi:hypothetical protein
MKPEDYTAYLSGEDVISHKLSEQGNGGVMFNVPNPESDIDSSVTKADRASALKAFIESERQKRPQSQMAHAS